MKVLRKSLNDHVEKVYGDLECPCCSDDPPLCSLEESYFDRFLEAKQKLGDETDILDSSVPLALLKTFSLQDCLECWLCLCEQAYEFVPVFVYTQAYLYIFPRKSYEIKVLALDQTLFSVDADEKSLEDAAMDIKSCPKNLGWKKTS